MGKKKSKKISDSAYLKLQEMITDGLDSVLESMNEVLKEKPPVILIKKDKGKEKKKKD